MSLSRWKMMAGVLGVSIGGLAAAASQCPKLDKTKGRSPEAPVTAEAPKLPPAGAPALPVPGPTAPQLTPVGVTPPALPIPATEVPKAPAPVPAGVLPAIPDFTPPAPAKPADVTPPAPGLPGLPGIPEPGGLPPAPATKPSVADALKALPMPTGDLLPPPPTSFKPTTPVSAPPASIDFGTLPGAGAQPAFPGKPVAAPPVVGASGTQPSNPGATLPPPPPVGMGTPGLPPIEGPPPALDIPSGKPLVPPTVLTPPATVAATKFRILLRVGEGEPTFEVKCGDDLVMKVACEKVDIKSPEKGSGLSAVTAKGKVRFAGFGVEGTCDELSFMAGTGEVSMSGDVKVQVKDKLGRVESELTTATLKYKIDASAVGNALKP